MTGISSRATNGNVTNAVARISPGVAKMILEALVSRPDLEVLLEQERAPRTRPRRPRARPARDDSRGRADVRGLLGRAKQHVAHDAAARRRANDVRYGMIDSRPCRRNGPKYPCRPKISTNIKPGHDRRHRERQVDQRGEHRASRKTETGDRPRRGDPEDQIGDHRDGSHRQRQDDRMERVRIVEQVVPVDADPVDQGLGEDVDHGNDDQHADDGSVAAIRPQRTQTDPAARGLSPPRSRVARRQRFRRHGGCSSVPAG